jgi:DNA-binding CsgD family transcriptional regulator
MLPFFKSFLEGEGFSNLYTTSEEKDSLIYRINEIGPRNIFIESCFYEAATPYMMGRLLQVFKKLKITAISLGEYPEHLARYFYYHGVENYLSLREGIDEFYFGLGQIKQGISYRSPLVQACIDLFPEGHGVKLDFQNRQLEIMIMVSNGFTSLQIGNKLHISKRTVENQKQEMYEKFHVCNEMELIKVAYYLDVIKKSDLCFSDDTPKKIILPDWAKNYNRA